MSWLEMWSRVIREGNKEDSGFGEMLWEGERMG